MMRVGAFLINLDRDHARLAHMKVEAMRIGLSFMRFPGVHGTQVPPWLKPWFFEPDGTAVASLKPGEIGVYASHLCLHRLLLERADLDAMLVMEDDLTLTGDIPALLAVLDDMPDGWDILKLSNPPKAGFLDYGEISPGMNLVHYSRVPNNLGAYIISKSGAMKTLHYRGIRRFAIDEDMRRAWDWGLETWGILPAPCRANVFEASSIDAMGARALGKESFMEKLKRRRWPDREEFKVMLDWQLKHLGILGLIGSIIKIPFFSIFKRMRGRKWAEGEGGMAFLRVGNRNLIRAEERSDP